jgi:hypothetical protein
MVKCLREYSEIKPDVLITHEPPRSINNIIGKPGILEKFGYDSKIFTTRTSELIEECLKYHRPKYVISGHMHVHYDNMIDGTRIMSSKFTLIEIFIYISKSKVPNSGKTINRVPSIILS